METKTQWQASKIKSERKEKSTGPVANWGERDETNENEGVTTEGERKIKGYVE
jgi:hypothetical protein